MKLITLSPIFIGDGKKLLKKEYIYDEDKNEIIIPDLFEIMKYFYEKGLYSKYEESMTDYNKNALYDLSSKKLIDFNKIYDLKNIS